MHHSLSIIGYDTFEMKCKIAELQHRCKIFVLLHSMLLSVEFTIYKGGKNSPLYLVNIVLFKLKI